ncbi:MAG: DNA glycosylase [Lachnospiraceae bacterium]|nr:DNA glycosylase [Lachnospiraceae bacterium]
MKITIADDFDLCKIAYSGQCFRVKELDKDTFRFVTKENTVEITDESYKGGRKKPDDETILSVSCAKKEWDIWHDYFDLDTNYAGIRKSIPREDDFLRRAAESGAGIRILKQDLFEMLISFIISQRKSIPAIKTSIERLVSLYGQDGFFPTPEALKDATSEELASCGLGYRVPYIMSAVRRVYEHEVDLDALGALSDEELVNELKSFAGVGDKVANCVALFGYHRCGLAPIDTWIARVIKEQYCGTNPFPRYGNVAGIMQQYMFYYMSVISRK